MAAGGYPETFRKGDVISGLPMNAIADVKVFHSGTALQGGNLVTSGGRVLCVTALGDNVSAAQTHAYDAVEHIHWQDAFYRRDIGYRAIARENTEE